LKFIVRRTDILIETVQSMYISCSSLLSRVELTANFVYNQFIYMLSFRIHKSVDMKSSSTALSICTCGLKREICASSFSPNREIEPKLGQTQPAVEISDSLESELTRHIFF